MYNKEEILATTKYLDDIIILDSIDSTNNYAKTLAKSTNQANVLVVAKSQTKGRGRNHKTFYSPENDGIYMSLLIRPKISFEQTQLITILTALTLSNVISQDLNIDNAIKWINDIYIDNRKVAGILVDGQLKANYKEYEYLVIGIGININQAQVPDDIKDIYTALANHSLEPINKNTLIANIINSFYIYLDQLEVNHDRLIEDYKNKCLTLNKTISINGSKDLYLAKDIAANGNLIIADSQGNLSQINSGEVSIKNEN